MSESWSLADELRDEREEESGSDTGQPHEAPARNSPAALPSFDTLTATEAAVVSLDEAAIEDVEAVLLDNDPLVVYLHDKQLPQPAHTVSAPSKPDGRLDPASATAGEGSGTIASEPVTDPLQLPQALLVLLSVLCPCVLAVHSAWRVDEDESVSAERRRCHRLCEQQLQPASQSASAQQLSPASLHAPAGLLRLSVWLHGAALAAALSGLLVSSVRAVSSISTLSAGALLYSALAVFCACNWTGAQRSIRLLERWQSAHTSLVSLASLNLAASRLLQRSIRLVCEVELVARGYQLSDNLAPAVRLDQSQPHHGRAHHIRHTLQRVLSTATHSHEHAQLSLLASPAPLCAHASTADGERAPLSIAALKERIEALTRLQATTWSLLSTASSTARPLAAVSVVDDTLLSLLSTSRQLQQLLDNATSVWRPHTATPTQSSSRPTAEAAAAAAPASSSSSLRRLCHQLHSAEVRSSLACEQLQADATAPLHCHIDYIRRAAQEVQRMCDELSRQPAVDNEPPSIPARSQLPSSVESQETVDGHEESAVLSELRRTRPRGQLVDGQGAVFEGEGQWKDKGCETSSDDEGREGAEQRRLARRRRMAAKPKASATPASAVSMLAANLSMVRELKSVLSHRPAVSFASVQADGDGTGEVDNG